MSTLFPTSIDSPVDPTANNFTNNPSHSAQHGFENDAIVALETKVGVNGSAVTSTIDYLLKSTSSVDPGHLHTFASLENFSVTSPVAGQFLYYNGTNWINATPNTKFGGTGSDGNLSISSGTTTINCANAAVVIKNYTSISITGTASLVFSNPNTNGTIIVIKCQGNVVLTTSATYAIDVSNMGAAFGAVGILGGTNPTAGTVSYGLNPFISDTAGGPGAFSGGGASGAGSAGALSLAIGAIANMVKSQLLMKYPLAFPGSGGGGGGTNSSGGGSGSSGQSGHGGNGGGVLIIECGGALNFTSTINANGQNGQIYQSFVQGSVPNVYIGGGGGGGAGIVYIYYTSLIANSGTINVSNGTNGGGFTNGSASTNNVGGLGVGIGQSFVGLNTEFA